MKTIFTRITTGLKKGWSTPTLPVNIMTFKNNPIIRIFRALGGLSFIIILGRTKLNFPNYFLYLFLIIALLFTVYHFVITFFRIKHIYMLIKNGELDIRNSPLDRFASLWAKAILCLKGTCEAAQPVGLTLGIMLGTYEVLKNANRQPLFGPFLGQLANSLLPEHILRKTPEFSAVNQTLDQMVINHIYKNDNKIYPKPLDVSESGIGREIFDNISNFFSSYTEYLGTLNTIELGALTNLIFTFVIFSSLISLIVIFFSNYFIKRLDLTNYPRIKQFLDLRSKFKVYYFIFNALMILIGVLALFFVNISLFLNY